MLQLKSWLVTASCEHDLTFYTVHARVIFGGTTKQTKYITENVPCTCGVMHYLTYFVENASILREEEKVELTNTKLII